VKLEEKEVDELKENLKMMRHKQKALELEVAHKKALQKQTEVDQMVLEQKSAKKTKLKKKKSKSTKKPVKEKTPKKKVEVNLKSDEDLDALLEEYIDLTGNEFDNDDEEFWVPKKSGGLLNGGLVGGLLGKHGAVPNLLTGLLGRSFGDGPSDPLTLRLKTFLASDDAASGKSFDKSMIMLKLMEEKMKNDPSISEGIGGMMRIFAEGGLDALLSNENSQMFAQLEDGNNFFPNVKEITNLRI